MTFRLYPSSRSVRILAALPAAAVLVATHAGCGGRAAGDAPVASRYVDAALPPGPQGLYAEGVLARKAGDEDRALRLLTRAAADGRMIMPNQVLGEMYRQRQAYADSERFFRRMLELDPRTPRNYFNLALTQELMERFGDAVGSYDAGLRLAPADVQGNLGIGRTYLALSQPAAALPPLERATQADPADGDAWLLLGRARDAVDDAAGAEAAYRRALETQPQPTPELLEALGANLTAQGNAAEAIPLLERAAAVDDTAGVRKLLGDAHVVAGNLDRAHAEYDAALAREGDYVPALNGKGSVYILQFRQGAGLDPALRDRALALWRRSLELEPDQPAVQQAIEQFSREQPLVD